MADIDRISPNGLPKPFGPYPQILKATEVADLAFVSGQVGVDAEGNTVKGGALEQFQKALTYVLRTTQEVGAQQSDIAKVDVFIKEEAAGDAADILGHWGATFGATPPAVRVVVVSGFANPEWLVLIDAVIAL